MIIREWQGWRSQLCVRSLFLVLACLALLSSLSCLPVGDCGIFLLVEGAAIDRDTGELLSDIRVGGSTLTDGVTTASINASSIALTGIGRFRIEVFEGLGPCGTLRDFTRPDQVEIIVVRNGCESTHLIEVNEDTVVDLSFPNDTLELRDPILVPPCDGATKAQGQ